MAMIPKYNFTYSWTQQYPTHQLRPYLRQMMEEQEQLIEFELEKGDFKEANEIINKIKSL
jgi:hypothetical protein